MGSSMEAPPGRGRFLRPGTGLAGRAFWGGWGLEKSWGESHKPHSKPRGACSKDYVPDRIMDQNQMRKGIYYTLGSCLKSSSVHMCFNAQENAFWTASWQYQLKLERIVP